MRNENEVISSKNCFNPQVINNYQSNSIDKSDLNSDNKLDQSKPKLNLNAQSYIPKFVRKPSEINQSDKVLDNRQTNSSTLPQNTQIPSQNNINNKPTNPTYIPYQGGPSLNTHSINGLNNINESSTINVNIKENISENKILNNNDPKKININCDTFVPRGINVAKESNSLNLQKNEDIKQNGTSDIINNENHSFSSQAKNPHGKFGNLFNKKAEESSKKQPTLKEDKIIENIRDNDNNNNDENHSKTIKEDEKLFKPVFINSNKKIEDEKEVKNTEVDIIIAKKEENIIEYKIVNEYFKVINKNSEKTEGRLYDIEYLLKFRDWKICKEDKLIGDFLKGHNEHMKHFKEEYCPSKQIAKGNVKPLTFPATPTSNPPNLRTAKPDNIKENPTNHINVSTNPIVKDEYFSRNQTTNTVSSAASHHKSLGDFARKNIDEDVKLAQEFKEKISNTLKVDPIKDELTEHLNKLTLDNYDYIKCCVFDVIKGSIQNQEKLIEAIVEWTYAVIYSRLCTDLDRELPQKESESKISSHSLFRAKLLDKCKTIFQEDLENIENYINITDPEEKEDKIKKFTLGNVNFIGELINTKLISIKVFFNCIEHLFFKKTNINLEGIVILLEKFGTSINKPDSKFKKDELNELNDKISFYLDELDKLQNKDKNLPGYIKYKIINLREKRNRGWIESKVDQSLKIKTKQEVGEEYDKEQREKGNLNYINRNYYDYEDEDGTYEEDYVIEEKPTVIKKDSDEYIKGELQKDYEEFREYISEGNDESEFKLVIIDKLKKNNTLGSILKNFSEVVVDSAGYPEDIDYSYKYIKIIFDSYSNTVKNNPEDKKEILTVLIDTLTLLNEFVLDNMYLTDIWGSILHVIISSGIVIWKDFDGLRDLNEEQIQCISEVICKAIIYSEEASHNSMIEEIQKYSIFKANKNLFNFMWKSVSSIK